MDAILAFISSYCSYWPLVCFFALLLAGFNLPISEDLLIVMSALITVQEPGSLIPNYIGLYAGIFVSDCISYWFGRLLGSGVLKMKFLTRALSEDKRKKIIRKLDKHGFLTFVVTRFIPFGMRNALFMTSGFIKLNFARFMLFDSIAAVCSSATLYGLVLLVGERAQQGFKVIGIILFVVVWGFVMVKLARKMVASRKKRKLALDAEAAGNGAEADGVQNDDVSKVAGE